MKPEQLIYCIQHFQSIDNCTRLEFNRYVITFTTFLPEETVNFDEDYHY